MGRRRSTQVSLTGAAQALSTAILSGAGRIAAADPAMPPTGPTTPAVERMRLISLRLFAERGFHGTTVRDIARELGVKPASLYSLVESKDQILADLVRIGHDAHALAIRQAVEAVGDTPVEQLRAFVDAHVRVHARWPMLAVVSNNELHCLSPELAAPSVELRYRTAETLYRIIDRGRQEGQFDVPDTFLATSAIATMGMRVAAWFDGATSHTEDDVAVTYADMALRMVGADRSATS